MEQQVLRLRLIFALGRTFSRIRSLSAGYDPSLRMTGLKRVHHSVLLATGQLTTGHCSSVPADWGFVQIDVDLLGFQIFFNAPGAEFAAEAGLFVAAPG